MTREEIDLSIEYLESMKEEYIEGEGYERHPLPEYFALELAIKALETQDRLTKMLNKRIMAYAEVEKSKNLNDLEYGRKTAYALCLEELNDDE